ncbi:MAG: DNA/RNA non-specific endonuclease [Bacteroidales bacterium]|nr:DNA/RNA non-specific endonuclease [Candidatus Colimorpha onthohippi]
MKLLVLLSTIVSLLSTGCDHEEIDTTPHKVPLPAAINSEAVVHHYAYSLEYSETHEQSRWVMYMLCANRLDGPYNRNETPGCDFHEDPYIKTGSSDKSDYYKSGYSRGHLAPAADMKWDSVALVESFFFSNMSPMEASFNSGVWNRLETQVRRWAEWYDTLYIVTGPLLTDGGQGSIGENRVTIPTAFYKAIYAPSLHQAVGFLIPHLQNKESLNSFAMSIDQLEQLTQIDFFSGIQDESLLESTFNSDRWNWGKKQKK